jgi:tetratricopeptide (TPR) repeat protein
LEESEEAWRSAYLIAEDEGRREDMNLCLSGLVLLLLGRRRLEDAATLIDTMASLAEEGGALNQIAGLYVFRGRMALLENQPQTGIEYLTRAYALLQDPTRVRVSYTWDEGIRNELISITLQGLAEGHRTLGNFDAARQAIRDAIDIVERFAYPAAISAVLVTGARLLAAQGQNEDAAALLALVTDTPKTYEVERYRAASILARVRTELADDLFMAAVARGLSWSLDDAVGELMKLL